MARFLTAEWRSLVMLNYQVEPSLLLALVPRGTVLDQFAGKTYVSAVGFMFLRSKVLGIPVPFHRNFEELNLRFYVRRPHPDGDRRGVVFLRELVPRRAIAWVARTFYNEQYLAVPMAHRLALSPDGGSAEYRYHSTRSWHSLALETRGAAQKAVDGSLEQFITEHYWGYVSQRDGSTLEYQVEHPSWNIFQAGRASFDCSPETYGARFADALVTPSSAFLADGSPIVVHRGTRL